MKVTQEIGKNKIWENGKTELNSQICFSLKKSQQNSAADKKKYFLSFIGR